MANSESKKLLLEASNDEELKVIQDFIQERKIKAFMLEDRKPGENDIFNDMVRVLIPFI
ncbi:MAG TPA: hypothetical protein VF622_19665 [Segetibacter sp.]|jgi:hypothetical protein